MLSARSFDAEIIIIFLSLSLNSVQSTMSYSVSLNDDFFEVEVLPNKSEINLGIQTLRKGYNTLILKGL